MKSNYQQYVHGVKIFPKDPLKEDDSVRAQIRDGAVIGIVHHRVSSASSKV